VIELVEGVAQSRRRASEGATIVVLEARGLLSVQLEDLGKRTEAAPRGVATVDEHDERLVGAELELRRLLVLTGNEAFDGDGLFLPFEDDRGRVDRAPTPSEGEGEDEGEA
jgi:hypothetical protein